MIPRFDGIAEQIVITLRGNVSCLLSLYLPFYYLLSSFSNKNRSYFAL